MANMGQPISNGAGDGEFDARVDSNLRLHVFATTVPEEHHVNKVNEASWTFPFDNINPAGNDDYFFVVQNTNKAVRVVARLSITSTVAGFVELQTVTISTLSGGSAITPVPHTPGAEVPADLTVESGVDITGITDAGVHHFHWLEANKTAHIELPASIRLKTNRAMALLWTVSTGNLTGGVEIYEEG